MQAYNSMQRVVAALSHREADRVPVILTLTLHGAKELGLSIKEYFSSADNVFEGQKRLLEKFGGDAYIGFFHAPLEIAAFGGEVIYVDDGPPNSGEPFLKNRQDIKNMQIPDVRTNKDLAMPLELIRRLKSIATDTVPIGGVIMSPFSLPVMQMGFDKYLELIYEDRELFWLLMEKNFIFCQKWAEAQIAAGATVLFYFDPVSSPTIIPPQLYRETGHLIAKRFIPLLKAGIITHLASGICAPILPELMQTGTIGLGLSSSEDIGEIKLQCKDKLCLFGNLNGIEMRNWDVKTTQNKVREIIRKAAPGGGLVICDHHGELPWQISDETIYAISEAARIWGTYPIKGD